MGSGIAGSLMGHWELLLAATAAGLCFGVAILAASYLAPLIRLRLAANGADRGRVLEGELARLRRLGDAAAVLEEHGRPGAGELRAEIELEALLLLVATENRGSGRRGGVERRRGLAGH